MSKYKRAEGFARDELVRALQSAARRLSGEAELCASVGHWVDTSSIRGVLDSLERSALEYDKAAAALAAERELSERATS